MNPLDLSFWSRLVGSLALESAFVVGLVLVVERFVKNAFWRRTAWHIVMVMLLALIVSELSGFGRGVAVWLFGARREPVVETRMAPTAMPKAISVEVSPAVSSVPVESVVTVSRNWCPGIIWIAGTAIVLARVAFAQALLLVLRLRCKKMSNSYLVERALGIARRLGVRRKIQFLEVRGLKGPVAFGGLWPAVGLPVGFMKKFDRSQQDAMLAHELAHIAGGDPLWYRMADFVSACLWWQPLVWWSRHRLQVSSEVVADEGTVLLENGPIKLAECLVVLGRELTATRKLAWIGIGGGGFRSNLGKRVERLVNLKGREHFYSRFTGSATLKTVLTISGVVVVLILSGWGLAHGFSKGKTLKDTISRAWKGSAGASVVEAVIERPVDVLSGQSKVLSADPENHLDLEHQKQPRTSFSLINEVRRTSRPNRKDENPIALHTRTFQVDTNTFTRNLESLRRDLSKADNTPLHETVREVFKVAGLEFEPPETCLYNDKSGVLFVRTSLRNLDVIGEIVNIINRAPYQLTIEAKFVELPAIIEGQSAIDWLVEGTGVKLSTMATPATNALAIKWKFPAKVGGASVNNEITLQVTGILNDSEFRRSIHKVEQRSGTDILAAPKVTTLSGRQTHLAVQDLVTFPPSFGIKEAVPIGQVLDLLPEVWPDGYAIDLSVVSTVTMLSTNSLPPLRLRQMTGQYAIRDGQTLILAGVQAEETENSRKLLVFITATLIDAAGNRLHSEEELANLRSLNLQR